jgi:3-hydroxyisobutyrate dehydrogenase-like beta-hydroxyacid dehydrogenase
MAQLGFIGLGTMGSRVTKRLLDAKHSVIGYNRTKAKAQWLLEAGMQWGETPRQVAEAAAVVFSMVTNTAALQQITDGPDGVLAGLGPGKLYCEMSTVSPAFSRSLAERVAAVGARMLDVPVSGSVVTLEQGNLSLMVGGDQSAFEQVKPTLLAIGPKVNYMGGNGQAALMKIAINLSLATQFLAFSEGLLLAEKGGIPRAVALETLLNSAVASPFLKYRGPFVLQMPAEAWFDVNMMQKDLLLALEMGRALDVPLPSVALSNEFLTAARAMGLAKEDYAIMFEVLARMSGLSEA